MDNRVALHHILASWEKKNHLLVPSKTYLQLAESWPHPDAWVGLLTAILIKYYL